MGRAITALVAGVLLLAAPAYAVDSLDIRDVDAEDFPTMTLTVSVDSATGVDPEDVQIAENGTAVGDIEVKSVRGVEGAVDVVLAIDVSGSMEGEPMEAAITAARAFVEQLPAEIEVGVIAFGDEAQVVSPLTDDHESVLEAIGALEPAGDTALYDGLAYALDLFPTEGQHNIVLLSDGADNPPPFGKDCCSEAILKDVVRGAGDAQAKIFAVGLQTGDFKAGALRVVSNNSGGTYFAVTAVDLTNLYSQIATEITNQFLVTWESTGRSGQQLAIDVTAAGLGANVLLIAPEGSEVGPGPRDTEPEPREPLLEGAVGLAVVMGLTFGASFLVLTMTMGGRARRRRERNLGRRIGRKAPEQQVASESSSWIPEPLIEVADRFSSDERRSKIDQRLERAGWALKSAEYVAASIMGAIGGAFIGLLLNKNPIIVIAVAVLGSRIPTMLLSIGEARRLEKIQTQLPDVLMVLASSLRAGYSFLQALDSVAKEVGGPAGQEFSRVVAEIRLGRPIEEAMSDAAERIASPDFRWAVLAVNIQREAGGNLAELLDTVATTMREREQLRRQVKVLSAEGRLSMWILVLLPFVTGAWIAMVNPDYFSLLLNSRPGIMMVAVAGCLLGVGITWMKKVVKIDV